MTTVRILGSQLDEDDYFIDAEAEIDIDGVVTLTESTDSSQRTWTLTIDELSELREKNYAADHSALEAPDHELWSQLKALYEYRNDPLVEDVKSRLGTSAEGLFCIVVGSMRT